MRIAPANTGAGSTHTASPDSSRRSGGLARARPGSVRMAFTAWNVSGSTIGIAFDGPMISPLYSRSPALRGRSRTRFTVSGTHADGAPVSSWPTRTRPDVSPAPFHRRATAARLAPERMSR